MNPINTYLFLFAMLFCSAGFIFMLYLIKKTTGKTVKEPGKNKPAESGNPDEQPSYLKSKPVAAVRLVCLALTLMPGIFHRRNSFKAEE